MGKKKDKLPKEGSVQLNENGDVLGRVVYKYKTGLFGKFKRPEVEYTPPTEINLYLMSEVVKIGMVQYLHNHKMEVVMLSSEVEDFLTTVMFETEPSRLLILDYGRGTFLDKGKVDTILGLIEAFADIGKITIFSNTASFKTAVSKKFKDRKDILEKIDMHNYKGAVDIYETLLDKNEIYPHGGAVDIEPENVLTFIGDPVEFNAQQLEAREAMQLIARTLKSASLVTEEEIEKAEDGVPAFM